MGLRIAISLSKSKINQVHERGSLANADEKVIRLDIAMDEVFRMYVLNAS